MIITYSENSKIVNVQELNLIKLIMRKGKAEESHEENFINDEYVFESNQGLVSILFNDLLDIEKQFIDQGKLNSAELVKYAHELSLYYHDGIPLSQSVQAFLNKLNAGEFVDTNIKKIN